jgi:hypothetical protein
MQTYSIYIEYTDSTYEVIKRKCVDDWQAMNKADQHAESKDKEIYFIDANPI